MYMIEKLPYLNPATKQKSYRYKSDKGEVSCVFPNEYNDFMFETAVMENEEPTNIKRFKTIEDVEGYVDSILL